MSHGLESQRRSGKLWLDPVPALPEDRTPPKAGEGRGDNGMNGRPDEIRRRYRNLAPRGLGCAAVLLSACILTFRPAVAAQESRLSVDRFECVRMALEQNRELQIERLNPELGQLALSAAYGAYDPWLTSQFLWESATDKGGFDPIDFSRDAIYEADSQVVRAGLTGLLPSGLTYTIGGNYAESSGVRNYFNFSSYRVVGDVSVSQPLLRNSWTDAARLTVRLRRRDLKINELGLACLTLDVVHRCLQAYDNWLHAREFLAVEEALLATRTNLRDVVARQSEGGILTRQDATLAEAQVARVAAARLLARNAVILAENNLRTLLGDAFTNQHAAPLVPRDELAVVHEPLDLEASWRLALTQRPDLAQLKLEIEKWQIDRSFRRNQLFPSLSLFAGYGRQGADAHEVVPPLEADASAGTALDAFWSGEAPTERIGLVFSVPLSLATERANYRASQYLLRQAELRRLQKQELIRREVADAFHTVRASRERVSATRDAVRLARAALDAEERKLAGGKSTLLFVIQLQADFAMTEAAALRAKADYSQARWQLHFAEGSLLDHLGIRLESR